MSKNKPLRVWDIPIVEAEPDNYTNYEYFATEADMERIIGFFKERYGDPIYFAIMGYRNSRKLFCKTTPFE